jgi:hypothetical protein
VYLAVIVEFAFFIELHCSSQDFARYKFFGGVDDALGVVALLIRGLT